MREKLKNIFEIRIAGVKESLGNKKAIHWRILYSISFTLECLMLKDIPENKDKYADNRYEFNWSIARVDWIDWHWFVLKSFLTGDIHEEKVIFHSAVVL